MKASDKTLKISLFCVVLAISIFLLFFNLGHYALWDDEANCALFGESIWKTGDTNALLNHNLIAFNWGRELTNLHTRYIPPLHYYIVAPWAGLANGSSFIVRFPFALLGLCTILLIFFWMGQSNLSLSRWILLSLGILGNASFFLYFRQCRYYAPCIFFTLILTYLYWHRHNNKIYLIVCSLVGLLLAATNYLCFIAAAVCFIADYFIWGIKEKPLKGSSLAIIIFPILFLGSILLSIYNPISKDVWDIKTQHIVLHKITLFFWNLRDLNATEMGVGVFLLLSIAIYLDNKDSQFIRGSFAIFLYCFMTALFSPQPDGGLQVANVRYLAPLIPLCIFVSAITIEHITQKQKWLMIPVALLAFGTNILQGGSFVGVDRTTNFTVILPKAHIRSSILDFTHELIHPHTSAFRKASEWINENLKDQESIWIVPSYINYPLIFHAPQPTYAWQLLEKKGQFKNLPDIHFFDKIPPDYIMVFGPKVTLVKEKIKEFENKGIKYKEVAMIDAYWYDLIRPELFWHSFNEISDFSRELQAIHVFKLSK